MTPKRKTKKEETARVAKKQNIPLKGINNQQFDFNQIPDMN